jgi:hypothetical protein
VITLAGSGISLAMARSFATEGVSAVADIQATGGTIIGLDDRVIIDHTVRSTSGVKWSEVVEPPHEAPHRYRRRRS